MTCCFLEEIQTGSHCPEYWMASMGGKYSFEDTHLFCMRYGVWSTGQQEDNLQSQVQGSYYYKGAQLTPGLCSALYG